MYYNTWDGESRLWLGPRMYIQYGEFQFLNFFGYQVYPRFKHEVARHQSDSCAFFARDAYDAEEKLFKIIKRNNQRTTVLVESVQWLEQYAITDIKERKRALPPRPPRDVHTDDLVRKALEPRRCCYLPTSCSACGQAFVDHVGTKCIYGSGTLRPVGGAMNEHSHGWKSRYVQITPVGLRACK